MDAAEAAFADLGFSGARIDAIANTSGYNKSLIYQYFGDKMALYTEVVKRADHMGHAAMGRTPVDALQDESVTSDPQKFKAFLEAMIEALFEFLFEHPRYLKILFWEAADEWKTWNQISYRPDDTTELLRFVQSARDNGIIRADFDPAMFSILIMNVTAGTIRFSDRLGDFLEEGGSAAGRQRMVEQVCQFVTHGLLEPSLLSNR